jgi:hypothetical protein
MIARSVSPILLALTALLTSCGKPEVQSYRVPKEAATPSPAMAAAPNASANAGAGAAPSAPTPPNAQSAPAAAGGNTMANTAVATAGGPGLTWTSPSRWTPKPASAMRKGSYVIKGDGGEADLAISAFPGDVGGDLANLNRWRGQINLPPVSQAEFEAAAQRIERNGLRMTVVDLVGTGPNAQRILGAMIPYGGATWFVKLIGPDALVANEKPAFTAFLETIQAPATAQ